MRGFGEDENISAVVLISYGAGVDEHDAALRVARALLLHLKDSLSSPRRHPHAHHAQCCKCWESRCHYRVRSSRGQGRHLVPGGMQI